MTITAKQKETYRAKRLARQPKSIEAVLAYCAKLEASLSPVPPAVQEYLRRVREWTTARRNERVHRNMGLVGSYVHRRYRNALEKARVNFDDAMQEGAMGLMRAAELFDESREVVFSTYAVQWICQRLSNLLDHASLIHAPKYLFHEFGEKYPTDHFKVKFKEQADRSRCVFSLSTFFPADLEGNCSAEGAVEEPRAAVEPGIDASIDLEPLLRSLHPRHRQVIELRFLRGLKLDEVAVELAKTTGIKRVTRERVRQMVTQALARMRKAAAQRGRT